MENLINEYKKNLQHFIDDCDNDNHAQQIILAQTEENLFQIQKRKEMINYFNVMLDEINTKAKPTKSK